MMPHQSLAMGWQYLQSGNAAAAEAAVQPLLVHGINGDLLPLMAAIRLQQSRFSEAAPLFEQARLLQPGVGRFAYFHGAALAGMAQFEQAVPAYQAAIKQEPNFADAYLALGLVQRKLGQVQEAQTTYRKLLRLQPENVDGYIALSSALAEAGQFAEAEAPLRRALLHTRDPKRQAAIHNNLAILLENQNRHAEALENLDQTGALAQPGLEQQRINNLFQLGRFEECLLLYSQMLEQDPADAQTHRAYNSLLHRLGRKEEYLASYDRAPQTRDIVLGKAAMLMLQKRGAEAGEIYNRLLARDPTDNAAAAGLANALMVMGRYAESAKAFEAVINRGLTDTALFGGAAGAALLAGDPQKAEQLCQAGLLHARYDQTCLALLGTAWRLQDNAWDDDLNRYDSLIRVFDLEPPAGFSSMADFNAELGPYLERLHPPTDAYLEQSLHGGTQTEGNIFGAGHALVERLRPRIEAAVSSFVASLPADDRHPFLSRRAGNLSYAGAWSCMMRGQGFHVNHLHPKGWISSAYYVTVPDETRDADTRNGWLKFGEPSLELPLNNPVRRAVQPVPGRLVLFPSYMWHGTVPLSAASLRTTIAFDVVPG
ncbi:MAG: tetratricopeptide repeat protein [Rhizomicrobium sp.]